MPTSVIFLRSTERITERSTVIGDYRKPASFHRGRDGVELQRQTSLMIDEPQLVYTSVSILPKSVERNFTFLLRDGDAASIIYQIFFRGRQFRLQREEPETD